MGRTYSLFGFNLLELAYQQQDASKTTPFLDNLLSLGMSEKQSNQIKWAKENLEQGETEKATERIAWVICNLWKSNQELNELFPQVPSDLSKDNIGSISTFFGKLFEFFLILGGAAVFVSGLKQTDTPTSAIGMIPIIIGTGLLAHFWEEKTNY